MKNFITRWRAAKDVRMELNTLLEHPPLNKPIRERLRWLVELFQWMRAPGSIALATEDFKTGVIQATRVKYLFQVLGRNPEWRLRVAQTLRSIIHDTEALDLFCSTGLPGESGLLAEASERIMRRVLPQPPREKDLGEIFSLLFRGPEDVQWLRRLDSETIEQLPALLEFGAEKEPADWNSLKRDMEDALLILASQVRSLGLMPQIRKRLGTSQRIHTLGFFQIAVATNELVEKLSRNEKNSAELNAAITRFRAIHKECNEAVLRAHSHMDEFGVSVALVFQLEHISTKLERMDKLFYLLLDDSQRPTRWVRFVARLILESNKQKSLRHLFDENLSLISKKIAERSAETGDHYIARSRAEYWRMLGLAMGGGLFTAATALIKLFTEHFPIAYFMRGLLASANYSLSFVLIQLCGFTLGTKQPAMTATALAARMHNIESDQAMESLVDEIVMLIRSQFAAVLGNVLAVVPASLVIGFLLQFLFHHAPLSPALAEETLHAHSLLGPSIYYAAFTGVLLWLSSICAGWLDNWSAYRELPAALAHNRTLRIVFGTDRAKRLAKYWKRNIAGFGGNISLGILLGMSPKLFSFLGFPLDVRHVTLSSGTLTFAAFSLGRSVLSSSAFWLAMVGIVGIGVMNIGVAFSLAMLVAIRAREVNAPQRASIYRAVFKRLVRSPLSFFVA